MQADEFINPLQSPLRVASHEFAKVIMAIGKHYSVTPCWSLNFLLARRAPDIFMAR